MTGFKTSRHALRATTSAAVAIEARFQEMLEEGRDVISLFAGQSDFESPPAARVAGIQAIEENFTRYTEAAGTPALRALIARKLREENGLAVTPEQVVVSAGAQPACFLGLLAFADPGDEVFLPTPAWPAHRDMIALAGARPVEIPLSAANGYKLTAEALVGALRMHREHAGLLMFSNPCNPSGAVYARDELARLAEVVEGEKLSVIVDEVFEQLVYDGPFVSFATLPGMRQRTITVNGVSSGLAMSGWRVGYAAGPAPVLKAMALLQRQIQGTPCSISQRAAEAALGAALDTEEGREPLRRMKHAFARRRELVARLLDDVPGVTYVKPGGGFFFFVDVSAHYDRLFTAGEASIAVTAGGARSVALAQLLLENAGVAVVPGIAFGDDRCVRISFAASAEDLTVALKRIAKALAA